MYSLESKRKKRCGSCLGCLKPDCGKCKLCLDKGKFGGRNKLKKCCVLRKYGMLYWLLQLKNANTHVSLRTNRY